MQNWFNRCINDETMTSLIKYLNIDFYSLDKFSKLNDMLENKFTSSEQQEELLCYFCHSQRFVHSIYRMKNIWRRRRSKIYNTEDLFMNPIDPMQKNVVVILHNNTNYLFRMGELISSIEKSLSNCSHFFASPLICKNPYTNIPYNKSTLYNIYFYVKESTFLMPMLFHTYFMTNFNYNEFLLYNEEQINFAYLKTYIETTPFENVFQYVKDMFKTFNIKTRINPNFPNHTLFTIMKPYLKLYYISSYSINYRIKQITIKILRKKLHEFYEYNPNFGKRKIKFSNITPFTNKQKITYYYDLIHKPFYHTECHHNVKTFMTSHLIQPHVNTNDMSEYHVIDDDEDDDYDDDGDDDDETVHAEEPENIEDYTDDAEIEIV